MASDPTLEELAEKLALLADMNGQAVRRQIQVAVNEFSEKEMAAAIEALATDTREDYLDSEWNIPGFQG